MSSPAGTHTEPPAPTHLPGEAAKHRQQAQTWMPVSDFPGLEVGNWVTETPVGFFFSPGLVGIARKLSHNAKVSKSSGGAHPIDEETKNSAGGRRLPCHRSSKFYTGYNNFL